MRVMRQALWERGYILVIVGGEIKGFVQLNNTHLHRVLRLCIEKKSLQWCKERQKTDKSSSFKPVWVSNALDGSEDYLISDKIFTLVGEIMKSFRSDVI